jgi:hypothetical protein
VRPYSKNNYKQIGLGAWFKWYSTYLQTQGSEFNPQDCQKKKNEMTQDTTHVAISAMFNKQGQRTVQ